MEAIKFFSTFSSSTDDVTEKVGLGADGLVGGACDDTNFWTAAGIAADVSGIAEVAGIILGMGGACTLETIVLVGGGMVVTVTEDIALLTTFWGAAEMGVELNKGCLNGAGGVLAVTVVDTAALNGGNELSLPDDNGAFCTLWLSGVTTDCGFENAIGNGLLVTNKLGRLPPPENGGKDRDNGFLSNEKLLTNVEDGADISVDKILLAKGGLAVVVVRFTDCTTWWLLVVTGMDFWMELGEDASRSPVLLRAWGGLIKS